MHLVKKIGKALLFPHVAVLIALTPVSAVCLVCSMVFVVSETPVAYASYVLSAYTLTVWCAKIPQIIRLFQNFKNQNKIAVRWRNDVRLRVNVSLYASFIWNTAYAIFQLCLGFYHASFWYCSMAVYYLFLAGMRFFLAHHTRRHQPGERMYAELSKYRACGWMFLLVNLALSCMIFFMVYWNKTFVHHEITTIAMAAYTFTAFTVAVINLIKYRRYQSPVFSATKAINLASACVSMLTLTSTMLTTFGDERDQLFRQIMLGSLGACISVFIIGMAIYMIVQSTKKMKRIKHRGNR